MLSQQQKTDYIRNGAWCCPYCGSPNITAGSFEVTGTECFQPVYCLDCKASWQDVYQLTSIEEIE